MSDIREVLKTTMQALRDTLPCFDDRTGSPEVRRVYERAEGAIIKARAALADDGWRDMKDAPECDPDKDHPTKALLYSAELGVTAGTIAKYWWGVVVHVPGFHGNAVEHWGVTNWRPLPTPPEPKS